MTLYELISKSLIYYIYIYYIYVGTYAVPNTSHQMSLSVTFCEGETYTYFTDILCMYIHRSMCACTYIRRKLSTALANCSPVSCWSLTATETWRHAYTHIRTYTCGDRGRGRRMKQLSKEKGVTVCAYAALQVLKDGLNYWTHATAPIISSWFLHWYIRTCVTPTT